MSAKKKENTFLYYRFFLVILAFVTIGLTIAIVAIANSEHDNYNNETVELTNDYVLPDYLQGDNLAPEDEINKQVIIMSHTKGVSYDDIEEYYENAISKAFEEGDRLLAINTIIQKAAYIFSSEEDCERAIKYANNIDISNYSNEEKQFLASHLQSELSECNSESEEE